ncbi:hypothetical protein IWZ03DRAFT_200469 [Phyllosticta citriasiana]|uniref:Uncharacterized protein n=1 Tax=Phyllosticta citriasiana TaxID=595635 RepID=A0ABR1KL85_9PEZI
MVWRFITGGFVCIQSCQLYTSTGLSFLQAQWYMQLSSFSSSCPFSVTSHHTAPSLPFSRLDECREHDISHINSPHQL